MAIDLALFYALNGLAGLSLLSDMLFIFLAEYLPYLVVLTFFVWVYFEKNSWINRAYMVGGGLAVALVARFVVGSLVRIIFLRPRPFLSHDVIKLFSESSWSFPSGHALFFFALATFVYLQNKKWGWIFYGVSGAMVLARVISGVHYPTDILGGALLGWATAYVLHYFLKKMHKKYLKGN